MMNRQVMFTVVMVILSIALLNACSSTLERTSSDSLERSISLTSVERSKAVEANDIESFMVTLIYNGTTETEVNVSLETSQGASWQAALCYDDYCYIHNGQDRLVQSLPVAARGKKQLEIKMFVPKTAKSGEAKRLKVQAVPGENWETSASIDLEGYIP